MTSKKDSKDFVAYEYMERTVGADQASFYLDAYENFGWNADEKLPSSESFGKVTLHFRRDRKLANKTELTRLQRNFDGCMDEIRQMEASKQSAATATAIAVGVVGTAFMAGSVFAITAIPPLIPLSIVLAIPGFLGWTFPWFLHKGMVRSRTKKITPMIDAKYDEAYLVCEKGHSLL